MSCSVNSSVSTSPSTPTSTHPNKADSNKDQEYINKVRKATIDTYKSAVIDKPLLKIDGSSVSSMLKIQ